MTHNKQPASDLSSQHCLPDMFHSPSVYFDNLLIISEELLAPLVSLSPASTFISMMKSFRRVTSNNWWLIDLDRNLLDVDQRTMIILLTAHLLTQSRGATLLLYCSFDKQVKFTFLFQFDKSNLYHTHDMLTSILIYISAEAWTKGSSTFNLTFVLL